MAEASTVGIMLVVATAIGYFFGSWLDKKFGTGPWLMIVFTLMGIAAGFIELIRLAIRLSKN
jgi:F0F1-type ATP synthase assembly protein I